MSLEIAYAAMGGDLETVRGRLLTDERIEKFAKIFLQDTSMQTLESALEAGDLPEAYRGAHTLKGVSRDLGFTPLFEAAAALSDALRLDDAGVPANMEAVSELMPAVRDAYATVVDAIAIILQRNTANDWNRQQNEVRPHCRDSYRAGHSHRRVRAVHDDEQRTHLRAEHQVSPGFHRAIGTAHQRVDDRLADRD